MEFWNQRTFCLITGASRGIGRCIAVEFGKKVGPGSVFVLVALSAQGLQETKAEIDSCGAIDLKVVTATLDLGKADKLDYLTMLNTALITTGTSAEDFDHALLVHNAGSVGTINLTSIEFDNLIELRQYFEVNVHSMIVLTSQFFAIFKDKEKQRSVIQISSLCAQQPFNGMTLYCTGKAARDMFIRSIAKEEPSISAINYAPGPVDTDMYWHLSNNLTDPETSGFYVETNKNGRRLTPIQTITKLVRILGQKKYSKGEHVDYFDIDD